MVQSAAPAIEDGHGREPGAKPDSAGTPDRRESEGESASRGLSGAVAREIWRLIRPLRPTLAGCLLLMFVNRLSSLALPVSSRYLVNDVMNAHRYEMMPSIIGGLVVAACVQGITTYILSQTLTTAGLGLVAALRIRVQEHVARLPVSFYDRSSAGALASRIMSDVEGVRNLAGSGLIDLVSGLLTAIIALVLLLRISPLMTLLTFGTALVFALFLKRVFAITRPLYRERARVTAEVTGRLTESMSAVRIVKGYNAEGDETEVFSAGIGRLLKVSLRAVRAQSQLSLFSIVMVGLIGSAVVGLGAMEVRAQRMDVGSYVEFTLLLAFLIAPIALLVSVGTQLTETVAGLERAFAILSEPREDSEPGRVHTVGALRGQVVLRRVCFSYVPGLPVLNNIDLEAGPGTVTALVGVSGSGKSTIGSLISGFHTPDSGQVLIDGIDLASVRLGSYRRQLGIVLQDTFLFDGSIRQNVLFSRAGAAEEQWREACRIARVDEFAERLPDRYETVIGERGVRLSGGQRQRIAIARAIVADPRILILDEATSSLDAESEELIQEGLNYLTRGRTTFVMAHRLSTIRRADQILVLAGGRIVERGTHRALESLRGHYYNLYNRQRGMDENLILAPETQDAWRTGSPGATIQGRDR